MVQGHHSLMSVSDAAPLPRLGEVFFDVRGSSRSMRLSWYADTGVAVFSIWQGGMCTGTFRLPIGDLPRMVEILQRGPDGGGHAQAGQRADRGADWAGPETVYSGQRGFPAASAQGPADGRYPDDLHTGYGRGDELADPPRAPYGREELADPPRGPYGREELADPPRGPYSRAEAGYRPDELADQQRASYGRDEYTDARTPGYGRDAFSDGPYPGYREGPGGGGPGGGGGQGGHGREASADTNAAGYDQERFVPPYVRGVAGEYPNDIPAGPGEMPTGSRRSAYSDDRPLSRSEAADYPDLRWPDAGYSDGPQYGLPADGSGSPGGGVGPNSAGQHAGYQRPRADQDGYAADDDRAGWLDPQTRDYPTGPTR
jgi:hypothetical protein